MEINEIANLINAKVVGETSKTISQLNRIEHATKNELTFYSDKKYLQYLENSDATAIIVPENFDKLPKENQVFLCVANPYLSFLILINHFAPKPTEQSGIHPSAIIEPSARVHPTAHIGANCYIGEYVEIGANTIVRANTTIQNNSKIGENNLIHSNVSIYYNTVIGNNCIIHSGAVIGSDGFGFFENADKSYTKIPQIGNVVIENDVEIGANTTIDRALVGSTFIRCGVKLDNLIQIAHNVELGENTAIAALVGIAGSTNIGKRNRIGGHSGISGHISTSDDVTLMAMSGVPSTVEKAGIYFGAPIRDKLTGFKIAAIIHNLPELSKDVQKIKKKLEIE